MGDKSEQLDSVCPACREGSPIRLRAIDDHEYAIPFRASYGECDNCCSLYQVPMPSLEALAGFYPANYHSYTSTGLLTRIRLDMRIRRVANFVQADECFLDFGCGNGAFLYRAAEKLPGRRFFGYEISDRREVSTTQDGAVTIVKGNIQDLWEVLPSCRLITINHAIEHLPEPGITVRSLYDSLVVGGILEGQTPVADSLERRVFGTRWSGYHAPRHTVIFSRAGLKALLAGLGFADIEITGAFNPAALAVSLGSSLHGSGPGTIARQGFYWLILLALGAALAPIDLSCRAPGIMDFRATRAPD